MTGFGMRLVGHIPNPSSFRSKCGNLTQVAREMRAFARRLFWMIVDRLLYNAAHSGRESQFLLTLN